MSLPALDAIKARHKWLFSVAEPGADLGHADTTKDDLLITDIPRLVAALEGVLELHHLGDIGGPHGPDEYYGCETCGRGECPTRTTVERALKEEQ